MTAESITPYIFDISPEHQAALDEAIDIANAHPDTKAFLVLDLDDVVFDTRPKTHALFSRILHRNRPDVTPPTLEDARHGTRKSFKPLYDEDHPGAYETLNDMVVARPFMYKDSPLMYKNLSGILKKLKAEGIIPIMCLTARSTKLMEFSRNELRKAGLPDIPVFAKHPGEDSIAEMKAFILQQLAIAIPDKPIIMIDDQLDLINKIKELSLRNLLGILYDTPRFPVKGYTWRTIPRVLRRMLANEAPTDK